MMLSQTTYSATCPNEEQYADLVSKSIQENAQHKDTFMPKVISLPKEKYMSMIRTLKLPFRGIETSSVVGPFFWCAYDQDDDDPHLRKWNMPNFKSIPSNTEMQKSCTANQMSAKRAKPAAGR